MLAIAYLLLPYKASAGSHISQFLGDVSSILYNHLLYNHRYNAFRYSHEILYLSSNDKSIQICQNQEEPTWFHEILNIATGFKTIMVDCVLTGCQIHVNFVTAHGMSIHEACHVEMDCSIVYKSITAAEQMNGLWPLDIFDRLLLSFCFTKRTESTLY